MGRFWKPVIHDERCRRCGRCASVCENHAIQIPTGHVVTTSYGTVSIDLGLCDRCGKCLDACKLRAISKKFSLR